MASAIYNITNLENISPTKHRLACFKQIGQKIFIVPQYIDSILDEKPPGAPDKMSSIMRKDN